MTHGLRHSRVLLNGPKKTTKHSENVVRSQVISIYWGISWLANMFGLYWTTKTWHKQVPAGDASTYYIWVILRSATFHFWTFSQAFAPTPKCEKCELSSPDSPFVEWELWAINCQPNMLCMVLYGTVFPLFLMNILGWLVWHRGFPYFTGLVKGKFKGNP